MILINWEEEQPTWKLKNANILHQKIKSLQIDVALHNEKLF